MTASSSSPRTTILSDPSSFQTKSEPFAKEKPSGNVEDVDNDASTSSSSFPPIIVRDGVHQEITKQVLRQKLKKLRHLVIPRGIQPSYLDSLFPELLEYFDPQTVHYNGGIAKVKEWKISCYLEVMEGGIPCTNPNRALLELFRPLLEECNLLFLEWYRQQHACNSHQQQGQRQHQGGEKVTRTCRRLMTFVTRYTPAPGEQALLKHVDGAGKVDGSVVVALPVDRWSGASEEENSWIGHGGGLTFWDGKDSNTKRPQEIHYDTRSGDLAFIDRAVWHQADPITKGTRWALVIFYEVQTATVVEAASSSNNNASYATEPNEVHRIL